MTVNRCGCGRPAPDAMLCRTDVDRLRWLLRSVPGWIADLDAAELSGSRNGRNGSRSRESPLPCRPDVADLVDQLRHDLAFWCSWLGGPATSLVTVASTWLIRHLGRLVQDPDVYELTDVLEQHRRTVMRIIDLPRNKARVTVGTCPLCRAGVITAYVRDDAPLQLVCGGCGHAWGAHQLRRLERQLRSAMGTARPPWPRLAGTLVVDSA